MDYYAYYTAGMIRYLMWSERTGRRRDRQEHPPVNTFSSIDPSNQDLSGFELLFHEASQTFADTITNALSAEGCTQHKDVGDLWHSMLFHTSGVELRRLLPAPEQPSFTPRLTVTDGSKRPAATICEGLHRYAPD